MKLRLISRLLVLVLVVLVGTLIAVRAHAGASQHAPAGTPTPTPQRFGAAQRAYQIAGEPDSDVIAPIGSVSHFIGVYILDERGDARAYHDAMCVPQTLATGLLALSAGRT